MAVEPVYIYGPKIPAERILKIRPHCPSSAAFLADERDAERQTNLANARIRELNIKNGKLVNEIEVA